MYQPHTNMSRLSTVYARPATFLLCFNICTNDINNIDIHSSEPPPLLGTYIEGGGGIFVRM